MIAMIRRADRFDIGRIAVLVESYWASEQIEGFPGRHIEDQLGRLLAMPERGACWVAEYDGIVTGYLIAVYLFSLEYGGMIAEVDELYVQEQSRSHGAGGLLLEAVENNAKSAGFVRIQLQLGVGNEHARNFYARRGYGRRAGYELFDKALSR
jgi:GNAT superfamily N-acetyltransferase